MFLTLYRPFPSPKLVPLLSLPLVGNYWMHFIASGQAVSPGQPCNMRSHGQHLTCMGLSYQRLAPFLLQPPPCRSCKAMLVSLSSSPLELSRHTKHRLRSIISSESRFVESGKIKQLLQCNKWPPCGLFLKDNLLLFHSTQLFQCKNARGASIIRSSVQQSLLRSIPYLL